MIATQLGFSAREWMSRFEAAGGAYALTDGHIHLWPAPAAHGGHRADSFAMVVSLSLVDREALVDHLRLAQMVEG